MPSSRYIVLRADCLAVLQRSNRLFNRLQLTWCSTSVAATSTSSDCAKQDEGPEGASRPPAAASFKSPTSSNEQSREEEKLKRARMARNRENASLSRQRKKMLSEEKESQYLELQRHCANLNGAQRQGQTLHDSTSVLNPTTFHVAPYRFWLDPCFLMSARRWLMAVYPS